jgi:hypothetical protein
MDSEGREEPAPRVLEKRDVVGYIVQGFQERMLRVFGNLFLPLFSIRFFEEVGCEMSNVDGQSAIQSS